MIRQQKIPNKKTVSEKPTKIAKKTVILTLQPRLLTAAGWKRKISKAIGSHKRKREI